MSVGRSVGHIFEFRAVFALLLLPNRPRLDCRVSGLVFFSSLFHFVHLSLLPLSSPLLLAKRRNDRRRSGQASADSLDNVISMNTINVY